MAGTNPLSKHFRQPGIYLKLPSKGRYWAEGALDLPVTGEVPVYPMTTKDEITLRTPDALLNGQGVVDVIQSCVPSIKNAWAMPNVESDAVLIAIRIASFGSEMQMSSKCPHCSTENDHAVDLTIVLDRVRFPNYDRILEMDGLKFKIRPQDYFTANKASLLAFEEQKIMENMLSDEDIDERAKINEFNKRLHSLTSLNLDLLVGFTEYIELPDGTKVTDPEHIKEFYDNSNAKITRSLQSAISDSNKEAALPPLQVQCEGEECGKQYELNVEFDYARFFGNS